MNGKNQGKLGRNLLCCHRPMMGNNHHGNDGNDSIIGNKANYNFTPPK